MSDNSSGGAFINDPRYLAIAAWQEAKSTLDKARQSEAQARAAMASLMFPQQTNAATQADGTHYAILMNGWRLKATFRTNYTIDRDTLPTVLTKLNDAGDAGAAAAERVVRYKPELVMNEYKKLPPTLKAIMDEAITSQPAIPSFELVAPKTANGNE